MEYDVLNYQVKFHNNRDRLLATGYLANSFVNNHYDDLAGLKGSSGEPIQIIDDCVFFKYLVPRGEAYDKKYEEKLRKDDK